MDRDDLAAKTLLELAHGADAMAVALGNHAIEVEPLATGRLGPFDAGPEAQGGGAAHGVVGAAGVNVAGHLAEPRDAGHRAGLAVRQAEERLPKFGVVDGIPKSRQLLAIGQVQTFTALDVPHQLHKRLASLGQIGAPDDRQFRPRVS